MNPLCTCPKLNPADWEAKEHDWTKTLFWSVPISFVFHLPTNFAPAYQRGFEDIKRRGYIFDPLKHKLLQQDALIFGKLLFEVEKANPSNPGIVVINAPQVYSTVYQGPASALFPTASKLKTYLKERYHRRVKHLYFWNITCSVCTPDPKQQKTIIFAEL